MKSRYYTTISTGENSSRSGYIYIEDTGNDSYKIKRVVKLLREKHSLNGLDWKQKIKEISAF